MLNNNVRNRVLELIENNVQYFMSGEDDAAVSVMETETFPAILLLFKNECAKGSAYFCINEMTGMVMMKNCEFAGPQKQHNRFMILARDAEFVMRLGATEVVAALAAEAS